MCVMPPNFSKSACAHQKQPMPNVAVSVFAGGADFAGAVSGETGVALKTNKPRPATRTSPVIFQDNRVIIIGGL